MAIYENLAYLFQGIHRGITLLDEETYIYQALCRYGIRPSYRSPLEEPEPGAFVSRWDEDRFPLKVFYGAEYGSLFSPIELKELAHIVQSALLRIAKAEPDRFRFKQISERHLADVVIKFKRTEATGYTHCQPEIGSEKQITRAEMTINVPKNMSHSRVLIAVIHNLLHALGVYGHSHNPQDSGYREWVPQQLILTPRDWKTLQLLYRCPLGLTRQNLSLLWTEYQSRHQVLPRNIKLESIINDADIPEVSKTVDRLMGKASGGGGLSRIEKALQESFRKCINAFKTA